MTYRLPSLDLATAYDEPITALRVPGSAAGSDAPGVFLTEGCIRPSGRLLRLTQPRAVLGLRLAGAPDPLRLTFTLLSDRKAQSMWRQLDRDDDAPAPGSDRDRPRVVVVSVGGRPRGAARLVRRAGEARAEARLVVDLPAADLDESGVLLVEFHEPVPGGRWYADGLLPDGPVGVCVVSLEVGAATDPASSAPRGR